MLQPQTWHLCANPTLLIVFRTSCELYGDHSRQRALQSRVSGEMEVPLSDTLHGVQCRRPREPHGMR